jgi:glycosyltransferase involved in cell wall biosynthesis
MDFKDLCYDILSYTTRNIADYFFGCSQLAGEKRYGKKVANNKEVFTVLNNAIESDKYVFNENIRKKIRDEFSLTDSHFVIGHIGRFQKVKNHTFLVNIFKEIYEINPNAVLMLVGTGENIEQIKSQVKELNLENNVIFTGVRSDVNELLQAFDVFVFPSIYEGLPVTVVEAQAAGLPCLISDTITKEVSVTNLVNYASLSDSYKGWAEESIRISNKDRKNIKQLIIDAGYDIKTTSKWLENFYLNLK